MGEVQNPPYTRTNTIDGFLSRAYIDCHCKPQFQLAKINVPYAKKDRTYELHHRPLWNWAKGLLDHPRLINEFTWNAQKLSKWNGHRFERFFHEPWTAGDWWNVQSKLPQAAVPFMFI